MFVLLKTLNFILSTFYERKKFINNLFNYIFILLIIVGTYFFNLINELIFFFFLKNNLIEMKKKNLVVYQEYHDKYQTKKQRQY